MNNKLKVLSLASLMALTGYALTACSKSHASDNTNKEHQKVLTVGVGAAVPKLDPGILSDVSSARVAYDLFEGLVTINQNDEIIPAVAKSWDISKDGKTYTFHLRHNAKWSNGKPVTAYDFVYAFRRNLTPTTPNLFNTFYKSIVNAPEVMKGKLPAKALGVKAIDKWTLQFKLSHPQPYFLQLMFMPSSYPLYKPDLDKYKDTWAQAGHMVSNGAYELVEWIPNGHILVKKNPYYWDAKDVKINEVKYLPIVKPSAELNNFEAGSLDFTWAVPLGESASHYMKKFGDEFHSNTQLGNEYFWFNFKDPNFAKLKVRKALTMTVDRKAIVNNVLRMGQMPSYTVLPAGVQGGLYKDVYQGAKGYQWVDQSMKQRAKEARALLHEAGYSSAHPLTFTILYDTQPWKKRLVLSVIGMWQKAFGKMIHVSIMNQEWKVFLQSMDNHQFQMGLLDWKADYNDASDWVELVTCGSGNNYGQSCNMKTTKYFEKAVSQPTEKASIPYMTKAIHSAMEDYAILPLYDMAYDHLVSSEVGGYNSSYSHMNVVMSKWLYFKH